MHRDGFQETEPCSPHLTSPQLPQRPPALHMPPNSRLQPKPHPPAEPHSATTQGEVGSQEVAAHVRTNSWFASASQLPITGLGQSPGHKTQIIQQMTMLALRRESGKEKEEEWAKMMKTSVLFRKLSYCPPKTKRTKKQKAKAPL